MPNIIQQYLKKFSFVFLVLLLCQFPTNSTKTLAASTLTKTSRSNAVVTIRQVNHWKSGKRWYHQYELTLTNGSSSDLNGWQFKIRASRAAKKNNAWNTKLKVSGKTLTFTSLNYNKRLSKGARTEGIGFIISFKKKTGSLEGTYKYNKRKKRFLRTSRSTVLPAVSASPAPSAAPAVSGGSGNANVAAQTPPNASAGSAYTAHGALSVKGTNLVDSKGNVFQLKGVSTHGLAWYPGYVNEDAFKTLRDHYGVNTVRLAMYTAEYGGYCSGGSKKQLEALIDKGVNAAAKLGMYVIIDWHILSDNNPNTHKNEALDFFTRMSAKYKNYGNVLYEICNEPNGGTSWSQIKSYADTIIPAIRKNTNAVVLVGTPTWSQDVDQVMGHTVANPANVMYTLHFYAATHKDNIRAKLTKARKAGIPVFISEFSICDASGNGGIDYTSANTWKDLINTNQISYCGWSLSNKNETSALIKSSVSKTSGWSWNDFSAAGQWLLRMTAGQ